MQRNQKPAIQKSVRSKLKDGEGFTGKIFSTWTEPKKT